MIKKLFSRLADDRGAAAMEFALILPVIFALHIAAAEFLQAFQAQRKVTHMAQVMADITSQNRTVTTADLTDIMAASKSLIFPLPTSSLGVRISSVTANASGGGYTVDWTVSQNYTGAAPAVPNGYLGASENVIVGDVTYDYTSLFGMFIPSVLHWTKHAYVRPRLTPKIDKV